MPIKSDCHLHSSHSGDSKTPMEDMILQGIAQGLTAMCFTEHNDFQYPASFDCPANTFLLNVDSYLYDLARLREKYKGQIRILFGVELGLQPEIMRENAIFAKSRPFDFIIASSHVCHGRDPYYPDFFEGRSKEEAFREYFTSILENIKKFSNYDVYGHLDYVVRYGPDKDKNYSYETYRDVIDKILNHLIDNGKGIELNTGGIQSGMREFHPCTAILKRYHELGGEIITIGSDAHDIGHIGDSFDRAADVLKECGFDYYTIFENRIPEFKKI